jgi:hypothetical protein
MKILNIFNICPLFPVIGLISSKFMVIKWGVQQSFNNNTPLRAYEEGGHCPSQE